MMIFSLWNQTKRQIIFHGSELVNKDLTPLCISWHTELIDTLNRYPEQEKHFFRWYWLKLLLLSYLCQRLVDYFYVFICERHCKPSISESKIPFFNSFTHKTVNKFSKFSKKIFKIKILSELKCFLKEFIEELKLHFDFSEIIYFNYHLSFFDSFD